MMSSTILKRTLGLLVLTLFIAGPAFADEVKLKNGKTVKGVIVYESDKYVKIKVASGRTMRIRQSEIEMVSEGPEIGVPAIDKKLQDIDASDAEELCDVAEWAKSKSIKGWELLLHKALGIDEDCDGAHKLLGHHKAGDKWFKKKKDAEKYRMKFFEKEMTEKGYVKFKGAWIKKEDKISAARNKDDWMLDEEQDPPVWRSKAKVMEERGYVLYGDTWIRMTEEDKSEAARFKKLMGEEILPHTTKHFRLFVTQFPPDKVIEFGKLLEKVYAWFNTTVGRPADYDLFGGKQGHYWILRDKAAANEWYKHYRGRYGVGESFFNLMNRGSGNIHSGLLALVVPRQSDDPRNQLAHVAGHQVIRHFAPGLPPRHTPPWLVEAWGNMAEHVHLGNGVISCTTATVYAEQGGIAEKKFTTKDAPDIAKGLIRQDDDPDFTTVNKKDLNALDGKDLTKGWTIIKMLLDEDPKKLAKWLERTNTSDIHSALKEVYGLTSEGLDGKWRKKYGR